MKNPDILDSKIKKVRIELPHYSFSHSSSGESSHFVGRKQIQKKLAKLIEATTDKTGVYLVTGNRGVGKTSLVNQAINQTSLQDNSVFFKNIKYLLALLFSVAVTQFLVDTISNISRVCNFVVFFVVFFITFILLALFNGYQTKNPKCKCWNYYTSAIKELSFLTNSFNPYKTTQYLLKIILVVCYTQIISEFENITATKALVFYLCFVFAFIFWRFIRDRLHKYYKKYIKEELLNKNIDEIGSNILFKNKYIIFSLLILLCLPLVFRLFELYSLWCYLLIFIIVIIAISATVAFHCRAYLKKGTQSRCWAEIMLHETILIPIWNYIKNHRRLYLRINFGHKLKDEKDILRLITRTLSTEYHKYLRSFERMLPWRVMALVLLLLFAHLFSTIVEKPEFQEPVKKMYKTSSQIFLKDSIDFIIKKEVDQFVLEISRIEINTPQYLSKNKENIDDIKMQKFIFPVNYFFWLSFFSMYLFCILIFRSSFVTHFFVTHRIIKRQLKRLNSDITYSTERESSVKNEKFGAKIGIKAKKSRGVADAREIEKELQDILENVQRIPIFMCRPDFVIVFDELDKVEPDEVNLEKETQKTKASLFSIDNTRERQTEILKILSNMKYFLSTVKAKFIFIAGREMYDIYLADVSERSNYIGSIFNAVIYVPSFLTDHSDGTHADMTSLTEEFVCQRLIPHDYSGKPYNLKSYREYLEKKIYYDAKIKEIEREVQKIIDEQNNKEIEQEIEQEVQKIIDEQNNKEIEQIRNIITEHKEEIVQKIIDKLNKRIERKIQKIIDKPNEEIEEITQKIIDKPNEEIKQIRDIIAELNREIIYEINKVIYEINKETNQKIQKIIAVLQQFIIYLAHVSKGAPKEMMQLFESFIEVCEIDKNKEDGILLVQHYHSSKFFLTFNYYKQYTLGIIAYLMTPIFNRLSEGNIKEHSDKLLVSSLRFIDFLFKFHKHPFSWKHLDISPEMLEVNRSPELKSIAVDLLNYLAKIHINKSNFSFSDYKFDNLIANEIFAMTKTDEVFSALFSFSLDETLPLKKHYQDLLERTQKEYQNDINSPRFYQNDKSSPKFIDAISSLQVVLGDLHYYDDELEEAGVYYKNAVHALSNLKLKNENKEEKEDETMTLEQHYLYVRNMLRLGMIYEKRKQYDFAYLTYGEICKRIIRVRDITIKELDVGIALREDSDEIVFVKTSTVGIPSKEEKKYYDNVEVPIKSRGIAVDASIASPQPLNFKKISPNTNDMLFKKMTYEGLRMLYLPFIAKLQILEKSHIGGITPNHLEQLEKEIKFLTYIIDHKEAKLLEAEFYSRLADILYYKNSDLKNKSGDDSKGTKNNSCTACYYYHKALSILLGLDDSDKNTVTKLLYASVERIKDNYDMKYCTVLARILSDWGNVFFSCDDRHTKFEKNGNECYICDAKDCNTRRTCYRCACYICDVNDCKIRYTNSLGTTLEKYINYVNSESEEKNRNALLNEFNSKCNFSKMEIAFAMYAISLKAYTKSNLYKRSAYQIFKMLRLFKYYEIYDYIGELSKKAIRSLWQANEDLNMFEIMKRKKDFDKHTIKKNIPLQNILVDSEINRVRILVKDLELKSSKITAKELRKYYNLYITSPYGIIYSISTRIYQLRLKATVNYEAYKMLIYNKDYENERKEFWNKNDKDDKRKLETEIKFILSEKHCNEIIKVIFKEYSKNDKVDEKIIKMKIDILEKLIAETIFCFKEIIRLSKTVGETYFFNHIFMGSIHEKLTDWIRLYEIWRKLYEEKYKGKFSSRIDEYLEKYLGEEWKEQLSSYYEKQQALSHYYKCLETHNEGRAYYNMIDNMYYIKDDYNDRSDHFSIAEERHYILNKKIEEKIKDLKDLYKDSGLYKMDNYYEHG